MARVRAADRLLAESIRCYEVATETPRSVRSNVALDAGRATPGNVEAKIIVYAKTHSAAAELADEISRQRTVMRGLTVAGFIFAVIAGGATTRTAFGSGDGTTVNFFWLLTSLLGLHAISFIVWLLLMIAAPGATRGGFLGSTVMSLWRYLTTRFGDTQHRRAALEAQATRWRQSNAGRWLTAALSHWFWLGYLLGVLAMSVVMLGLQRYIFVWETTILDADSYIWLTGVLAALPGWLGVSVPDTAAVLAAEWPGSKERANEILWSSLLVGSIGLYGLAPRTLALVASLAYALYRGANTPLDMHLPFYAQLKAQLAPIATDIRVVDGDTDQRTYLDTVPDLDRPAPPPPPGEFYLLGWELDPPAIGWPPPDTPEMVHDLGCRDSHADLEWARQKVERAVKPMARLVVVVDLRATPDRGVTAALAALNTAADDRVAVLFTGANGLDRRLSAQDARIRAADWVAAAQAAGVDSTRMVAIDLDNFGTSDRQRYARLFGTRS